MSNSSSIPLSPPVTPKGFLMNGDGINNDQQIQNDPLLLPPSIDGDLHRKSNVKKFCRAITEMKRQHHSVKIKSMPQKSLAPSTQGTFTMDLLLFLTNGVKSGKTTKQRKRQQQQQQQQPLFVDTVEGREVTPNQPFFSTSSILNTERHVKKAKTDAAAAYDLVDITISDQCVFQHDPRWIPNMNVFNEKQVKVNWKGSPLSIAKLPFFDALHPGEVYVASTLRLTPEQYLKCRRSLILAAQDFDKMDAEFRKSDAQKCVRIDVNKTSALWNVFNQLGWFHPSP